MQEITSLKNPKVALWKTLKDRKGRKATGTFLVEGRKMVEEAIASGFEIDALLVQDDYGYDCPPVHCAVYRMPAHVIAAVCDTKTPQGIAAVVKMKQIELRSGKLIALDGVQDPGNVGTIIRTADCAGIDGIVLTEQCADVYSPKVLRATMGSIFRMPMTVTADLPAFLKAFVQEGGSVISSQLDGTPFYERTDVAEAFCLVIGNEGNGVSDEVQATATHRLKLPMRGGAESLNAAVAAGIMMYDLTR
ncbi:MAG: RNA methyltransferase [Clostridia bacterium]|nr:RNA methyltransferase [Clostridia bacterium]